MPQRWFLYSAFLSLLALIIALVSQHLFGLRPCAWCVFQRLLLVGVLALSVLGYLALRHQAHLLALLSRLSLIALSIGGILSAWYQYSVAAKMFSCDMTFADKFMTQSGLESAWPWFFGIYASCMDASVAVLGLDYALWSLLLFAGLSAMHLIALVKKS